MLCKIKCNHSVSTGSKRMVLINVGVIKDGPYMREVIKDGPYKCGVIKDGHKHMGHK